MPNRRLMFLLPLAALCLPAAAQEAASSQAGPHTAPLNASPKAGTAQHDSAQASNALPGMLVVRDAQTGELRAPTPAEALALQPATSARATAVQPAMVTGPGGRRSVRLGEQHMVYAVVTRGVDGKLSDQCVHGVHAAESALAPSTSAGEHRHEHR